MFEVVCTGVNPYYGKKGEKRLLSDAYVLNALRSGWITDKFKFVGHVKDSSEQRIKFKEELMPVKKIDLLRTLRQQNESLIKLTERINALIEVNNKLMRLR